VREYAYSFPQLRKGLRIDAELCEDVQKCSRIHVVDIVGIGGRWMRWADMSTALASYDEERARERQRKETEQESREREQRRKESGLSDGDQFIADLLGRHGNGGGVFRRSGPWSAELCGMSNDSSFLGYRIGTLKLRIWQETKAGWRPTDYEDSYDGSFQPLHLKCARLEIPKGGKFYIERSTPTDVNAVLTVRGGGQGLIWDKG